MKKLGDTEIEIMKILWEKNIPMTSGEILEGLNVTKSWKLSSLMTALERLSGKGFVICDRSTRTNYYSALIAKEEYQQEESRSFLERIFSNSVQKLVANLYDGDAIGKEDLASLKKWIEEVEQEEE